MVHLQDTFKTRFAGHSASRKQLLFFWKTTSVPRRLMVPSSMLTSAVSLTSRVSPLPMLLPCRISVLGVLPFFQLSYG